MTKKTALRAFMENFHARGLYCSDETIQMYHEYLRMEREQIVSAYQAGERSAIEKTIMDEWSESDVHTEDAIQYFNKTYLGKDMQQIKTYNI